MERVKDVILTAVKCMISYHLDLLYMAPPSVAQRRRTMYR